MCNWVHLPDKQNPNQRLCGNPGHPYCEEHQKEMDHIKQLDEDWKEIGATHIAVCETQGWLPLSTRRFLAPVRNLRTETRFPV